MKEEVSAHGGKNKIFAYIVLGLNVVAAWVSWWVLVNSFSGKIVHYWLWPVVAFSIWGVAFTLSCIFVKSRKWLYFSYVLGLFAYPLFMGMGWSLVAISLTFLLLLYTERKIKKELERGIKIDFYHLVSHSLKYFVSIACIIIAVAYYFSITNRTEPSVSSIGAKSMEVEVNWGLKALSFLSPDDKKKLIDEILNDISVDEFLIKNYGSQAIANNVPNVGELSQNPTELARMIGDATAQKIQEGMLSKAKSDLSKQLGVNVVGERPVKDVLMEYIDKSERSFFEYSGSEKLYVPIILAFGLFLTARILGTAVDIILGLFVLLVIKILRKTGVVSISHEKREVAMIEYSV